MNNTLLNKLNINSVVWLNLNVQDFWNTLENIVINTVDELAPIKMFTVNPPTKSLNLPMSIKQKKIVS